MAYSELDKLQQEVEKLKLEIKILKRPFTAQPTTWFTLVGLLLSVAINFTQCSKEEIIRERNKLEDVRSANTRDSLKREVQFLSEQKNFAENDLANTERRVIEVKKELASLEKTALNLTPENKTKLGNIKDDLTRVSVMTKNTTQNINSSPIVSSQNYKKDLEIAKQKERNGFKSLLAEDYTNAAISFQDAENASNGYHWVYELARLIRNNKAQLYNNPSKRAEILKIVVDKYSEAAPADLLNQIRDELKK